MTFWTEPATAARAAAGDGRLEPLLPPRPAARARAAAGDHRGRGAGRAGRCRGRRPAARGRPVARSRFAYASARHAPPRRHVPQPSRSPCCCSAIAVSGCGEEPTSEVAEGEPIELAGLKYNIQITRFLNPDDAEDKEYLVGQPPLKPGNAYLGVFMVIKNPSDEERPSATDFTVVDTLHNEYEPVESESPYALDIGSPGPGPRQPPARQHDRGRPGPTRARC